MLPSKVQMAENELSTPQSETICLVIFSKFKHNFEKHKACLIRLALFSVLILLAS